MLRRMSVVAASKHHRCGSAGAFVAAVGWLWYRSHSELIASHSASQKETAPFDCRLISGQTGCSGCLGCVVASGVASRGDSIRVRAHFSGLRSRRAVANSQPGPLGIGPDPAHLAKRTSHCCRSHQQLRTGLGRHRSAFLVQAESLATGEYLFQITSKSFRGGEGIPEFETAVTVKRVP